MSVTKSKALCLLEMNSDELAEAVIRCSVYANQHFNPANWVDEISEYLSIANDITVRGGSKLSKGDYLKTIFSGFGTTRTDAHIFLRMYRLHNPSLCSGRSPEFKVTNALVTHTYRFMQKIINLTLPILSSENNLSYKDIRVLIQGALDMVNKNDPCDWID